MSDIGDIPEPRHRDRLVGHGEAAARLQADAAGERLHHAWILSGPRGVGKATLAFRFARHLLAGRPSGLLADAETAPLHLDPADPVFRRVAAGGHADLRVLEPAGARGEIGVDAVRAAVRFLRLTPGEGAWRVLIVDGADAMNPNAQNAALKLLEEPPANVVILLVAHRAARLLATVRSRCRMLRLAPLGREEFDAVTGELAPELDEEARARLFALSAGSPGAALELAHLGGPALKEAVDGALDGLPALDRQAVEQVAELVAGSRDTAAFRSFGAILSASLALRLRTIAPARAWLDAEAEIAWLLERSIAVSLDRRQVVLNIFGALARAAAAEGRGLPAGA